jgi:predicted RNA methylase
MPQFQRAYLQDRVRNRAYQRALRQVLVPGVSSVADLGAGSGILSLLAARAGARRVVAIESSSWATGARQVVQDNQWAHVVSVRHADIRSVRLRDRVDVLVHDLIGTFVWDENAGELLRHARDHIGKPGCALLPAQVSLHWVPLLAPPEKAVFWHQRHEGFDFSALRVYDPVLPLESSEPTVVHWHGDSLWAAAPVDAGCFPLDDLRQRPACIRCDFPLLHGGRVEALLGFMTLHFGGRVCMRTDPRGPATSWGQMWLPLERIKPLRRGQTLAVDVYSGLQMRDWRVRVR